MGLINFIPLMNNKLPPLLQHPASTLELVGSVVFIQYYFMVDPLEQVAQYNSYDRYLHLVDFSSQQNTFVLWTRAGAYSSFYPQSLNQHQHAIGT